MALRAGLPLRDMEMVQFHPTRLLAGPDTRIPAPVEEGLRGVGGHLLDGAMRRFMGDYDEKLERATRERGQSRHVRRDEGRRTTPNGGLYIKMRPPRTRQGRKGVQGNGDRCRDCGFDLAGGLVEVVPTAHYLRVELVCGPILRRNGPGLFVAGEDASGMHGANRLGGNGVANSTVFAALPAM